MAREFYQRVKKHYDRDESWSHGERSRYKAYKADADAMFYFEPHVAEKVFNQLVTENGVDVVRGERLDLDAGVLVKGRCCANPCCTSPCRRNPWQLRGGDNHAQSRHSR